MDAAGLASGILVTFQWRINMASRGIQLIRTDDSTPGVVKFYRRDTEDVQKAYIGRVDVASMLVQAGANPGMMQHHAAKAVVKLAVHGATQNILDASNKLDGNERVDYIRKMCEHLMSGGWASAPVDEAAARKRAEEAIAKLPPSVREQLLKSLQG